MEKDQYKKSLYRFDFRLTEVGLRTYLHYLKMCATKLTSGHL